MTKTYFVKKITTGTYLSIEKIHEELKRRNCSIHNYALDLFEKFDFKNINKEKINFIVQTVEQLGLKNGPNYREICDRIINLGFHLCLPDDAPSFRAQYRNQPKNQILHMAMIPMLHPNGEILIFCIGNNLNGKFLGVSSGHHNSFFSGQTKFLFRDKK